MRRAFRQRCEIFQTWQRVERIPGRGFGQFLGADATQPGHHAGNARQLSGVVAALRFASVALGLKLGFGGAVTFERALQLRRLATSLPLESIVMETDAPDIQPHWLYRTQAQRDAGEPQGRNDPGELPRIAGVVAGLRGIGTEELAEATTRNALDTLPRLKNLTPLSERPPHRA